LNAAFKRDVDEKYGEKAMEDEYAGEVGRVIRDRNAFIK
jgi:hypothetical protein